MSKCSHINRPSLVVRGQSIGSPSLGQCEREALPGMTVCCQYADIEAMGRHIKDLWEQLERAKASAKEGGKNNLTRPGVR